MLFILEISIFQVVHFQIPAVDVRCSSQISDTSTTHGSAFRNGASFPLNHDGR